MRNRISNAMWALIPIAVGIIWGGNALGYWTLNVFFDGWWAVVLAFIFLIDIVRNGPHFVNSFLTLLFVALFVLVQDWMPKLGDALIPAIFIVLGVVGIFSALFGHRRKKSECPPEVVTEAGNTVRNYSGVFAGNDVDFGANVFEGARLYGVFGGVKLDLRRATIPHDCKIESAAVFGSVEILLPDDVNVHVDSTPVLGGVECKRTVYPEGKPTVWVSAVSVFGGTDIR